MPVHAPFRFAPISRRVWFPDWGPLVSHDVPFADGLSGEIEIEIEAKTPLLVGGPRRKATAAREGEVRPFEIIDRDGKRRYAIPGSSLQGMIRSILEIATFGKLGDVVADQRFGIRDLTDAAAPYYRRRMLNKVKVGFLQRSDGNWTIKECGRWRIKFANLPTKSSFDPAASIKDRYDSLATVGPYNAIGPEHDCTVTAGSNGTAWIVVTGPVGSKKKEFVFVENAHLPTHTLDEAAIRDFRHIHEQGGKLDDTEHSGWNETWRYLWVDGYPKESVRPFGNDKLGGRIPVFFIIEAGRVASFGLAYMFKLAHELSTHDMLRNSHADHLDATGQLDFPTLLFGRAARENTQTEGRSQEGLKRRVSFDTAVSSNATSAKLPYTVLLSPKASYFPIYVRQPHEGEAGKLPKDEPYATYTPSNGRAERSRPELTGTKVWPARQGSRAPITRPRYLPLVDEGGNAINRKTSTTLIVVKSGAKFSCTIRFHNLRRIELGGLLWALSWGEEAAWSGTDVKLRHRLGMAKPYMCGEAAVRIRSVKSEDVKENPGPTVAATINVFVGCLDDLWKRWRQPEPTAGWVSSAHVSALLKTANPVAGKNAHVEKLQRTWEGKPYSVHEFDYMELNPSERGWNEFRDAKNADEIIGYYAHGEEISRPAVPPEEPNPTANSHRPPRLSPGHARRGKGRERG